MLDRRQDAPQRVAGRALDDEDILEAKGRSPATVAVAVANG
jgi:hypothetical protein